ncbi:ubiquitin-specific protease otu1 [Borealophlyctis nickersoniae]|nr:ubiquitin-specific protease otu1 [Borealophlyctis nickersoniae]
MRLRCRSAKGTHTIGACITPESTLGDLKRDIEAATGVPASRQLLKLGFPPKPVSAASDESTLESCQIKDGEQIVVEEGAAASPVVVDSKPEAVPQRSQPPTSQPQHRQPAFAQPAAGLVRTQVEPPQPKAEEGVRVGDGILVVREMKDDNSCLFRSIGYVLDHSPDLVTKYRQVVVDAIASDPVTYNEAILGRDPEEYKSWILKPQSWGGAIELAVFAEMYQVEIASIDVSTLRVDRFGEGQYPRRVILLYSGIHYDAVALTPTPTAPHDFDQTTFEGVEADRALEAGVKLAEMWKKMRKFTDLANFTLKCGKCGVGLKGQKDAQAHAMETGHAEFTEY